MVDFRCRCKYCHWFVEGKCTNPNQYNVFLKEMKKIDNHVCLFCGKPMKPFVPSTGKFKGEMQKYSWVCDCKEFPKDLVINIG